MVLKVGRRDVARRSVYAQLDRDPTILALPDTVNDFLPRSALAFRDRLVLAVVPDQVERIALAGPSRKLALQAPVLKLDPLTNAPIGWWMVDPVIAPADPTAVGRLLRLLSGLRAEGLVAEATGPDDLQPFGLAAPVLTVTWSSLPRFSMRDGPPGPSPAGTPLEDHSMMVGSPVPGRPGQRFATIAGRPLVFTIGPEALGALDAEYHDRRVLSFNPAQARRVRLAWPDRSLALISDRRSWTTEGPVDAPGFDPGRILPLLKGVSDLSTPRYVQYLGAFPAATGLASPRLAVRVEFDDGTPPREIRVGHPAGRGLCFATTSADGQGPVFLVPESLFTGWTRPPRQRGDLPDDVFAP